MSSPNWSRRVRGLASGSSLEIIQWARDTGAQLNAEQYISKFSGKSPNSLVTGAPGDICVNVSLTSGSPGDLWTQQASTVSRSGWTRLVSSAAGGSGAGVGSAFVIVGKDAALTSARSLAAGTNITFTDGGAASILTISATGGSSGTSLTKTSNISFTVGSSNVTIDLATTGVTAGSYNSLTVDAFGRVTAAQQLGYVTSSGTSTTITSRLSATVGSSNITLDLPGVGTAGSYAYVSTDAYGRVTAGSTSLSTTSITGSFTTNQIVGSWTTNSIVGSWLTTQIVGSWTTNSIVGSWTTNSIVGSWTTASITGIWTSDVSASNVTLNNEYASDGTSKAPSIAFKSEVSLGWLRSGNSVMQLSYGTLAASNGSFGNIYTQTQSDASYAPTGAAFAVVGKQAGLASARSLRAGANITLADGGAGSVLTISAAGGAGFPVADGTALAPSMDYSSESSLGWYRSGASSMGLSYGQLQVVDGTALRPPYAFSSESSLGWYRSANSILALSYGTLASSLSVVGTGVAPTQAFGDNTTNLATTAFVTSWHTGGFNGSDQAEFGSASSTTLTGMTFALNAGEVWVYRVSSLFSMRVGTAGLNIVVKHSNATGLYQVYGEGASATTLLFAAQDDSSSGGVGPYLSAAIQGPVFTNGIAFGAANGRVTVQAITKGSTTSATHKAGSNFYAFRIK